MNRMTLLAAAAFASGAAGLMVASEGFAAAQCGDPLEVSPARCKSAYSAAPFQNSSGTYCGRNGNGICVNDGDCVDSWGVAYSGKCEHTSIGGSGGSSVCQENDHVTIVSIKWYSASCIESGPTACFCQWTEMNDPPPENVQMCDCRD